MNSFSFTESALAQSLSIALLYSLAQGFLVFGVLFFLLKALPGMSAKAKYYLSFSAFTTIFLWFADTWVNQYYKLKGVAVYITNASVGHIADEVPSLAVTKSSPVVLDFFQDYFPNVGQYVPFIVFAYSVGLAFMVLRFALNAYQLRKLHTQGVIAPQDEWLEFVGDWQQRLGISKYVKLLLSDRVDVPLMLGTLKPIILLPVATINNLSTEQVEAIILHELAHIKRHDYLLNLLQTVIETLLFFNPFIWLISSTIRREREHCCDDLVLSCASSPLLYANALALLEDQRINNSLSLAATGNNNQLFNRIKRIMEMKKDNITHSRLSVFLVATITLLFLSATISFTTSFAQKAKETKKGTQVKTVKTITIDSNGKKNVVTKTTKSSVKDKGDAESFDVNISVDDPETDHASAKIIVSTSEKGKGKGDATKSVKRVVITSNGAGATTSVIEGDKLDDELNNAKSEIESVDWDEIRAEINKALAEVDKELNIEKLTKEISIEIKKELEKNKAHLEEAKRELANNRRAMADAKAEERDAQARAHKSEMEIHTGTNEVDIMLNKMEKDGLIDRSSKFKVEKEEGRLTINGTVQPAKIQEKYSSYFRGSNVIIKGDKEDLNINIRK